MAEPTTTAPATTLYDANPEHLWNSLHSHLFVRTDGQNNLVGADEVDPLLWYDTVHLLEGHSHDTAIRLLNEFTANDGHRLVQAPLKRAILQHDLWHVFDWLAIKVDPGRRELDGARKLRRLLATAIRQLALTNEQISGLPDSWSLALNADAFPLAFDRAQPESPFLPPDLFDENSPWICLARSGPDRVTARLHTRLLGARSVFLVFIRLPGPAVDTWVSEETQSFQTPDRAEKESHRTHRVRFQSNAGARRPTGSQPGPSTIPGWNTDPACENHASHQQRE